MKKLKASASKQISVTEDYLSFTPCGLMTEWQPTGSETMVTGEMYTPVGRQKSID